MREITIPSGVSYILNTLSRAGYSSYIVGGCVRDSLLGLPPKDWDICTAAKPEEVKACLSKERIIDTGLKHGTVTVLLPDGAYEVTTFRVDGTYSDNRRPDFVEFVTDIEADLARRDFTVNAMAYHPETGVVDPFGGQECLRRGVIRCVGVPQKRFDEDGLRIMRAIRFASVYGFTIESATAAAVHAQADLLRNIAAERIREELQKLILGKGAGHILLEYRDVISVIIPEFESLRFSPSEYTRLAHAVSHYGKSDICVALALFLHDMAPPAERGENHAQIAAEAADRIAVRLRFDNKTRRDMTQLIQYHETVTDPSLPLIRHLLGELGEKQFFRLIEFKKTELLSRELRKDTEKPEQYDTVIEIAKQLLAEKQCLTLHDLALNGNDLIALGIPKGEKVGLLLARALSAVLDGKVPNDKAKLSEYILTHTDSDIR